MPRSRKGAGKAVASQGVKDAKSTVRDIQKRTRELLKKAGRNVREVRHDVSELKKSGLVSKRLNVRAYQPSKYMLRKIEKNRDVLSGEVIAVRAPKNVREKYTHKGIFEARGSTLIVPREYANQKTRITRGLVELSRNLRMGEEVRLILPFKATDMEGIARGLLADPSLDGMKKPNELFGFRLFGHNMNTIGFPDVQEFANYILTHYAHLFSGKNGRESVKHFEIFRFRSRNSQPIEGSESGKIYSPRPRSKGQQKDFIIKKRLERDAARKRKLREREGPAKRKTRLEEQRIRQAQYRQRKFLED